jgi:hypothetical protein
VAVNKGGQESRSKQPRLFALRGAPAMKLSTIRQIEFLEEIALQRLRGRAQRLGREGGHAVSVSSRSERRSTVTPSRLSSTFSRSAMIAWSSGVSMIVRSRVRLHRKAARGSSGRPQNIAQSRLARPAFFYGGSSNLVSARKCATKLPSFSPVPLAPDAPARRRATRRFANSYAMIGLFYDGNNGFSNGLSVSSGPKIESGA